MSVIAGLACVLLVASSSLFAPAEVSDQQAARDAVDVAEGLPGPAEGDSRATGSTVYPYSVVPGGVHSTEALAAAVKDPLVATHYASIDIAQARIETVPAPRRAYVSYRIGNRLYWTSRTVALHPGEQVLTDGRNEIRARCGNRISETPQQPTSDDEPEVAEFDRALAPSPDPSPEPFTLASATEMPQLAGSLPGTPGLSLEGPFTLSSAALPPDTERGATAGLPPGANLVLPTSTLVPDDGLNDGTDGLPPFPPGAVTIPIGGEPPLTPVPEPGSIVLIGTGLAGCAIRAWSRCRRKSRSQEDRG